MYRHHHPSCECCQEQPLLPAACGNAPTIRHRIPKRTSRFRSLVAAASLFVVSFAQAAGYPEKPINMIVAYAPGGGTDLVARAIAPYIEKYLGNNAKIVVHNRPGAGGGIGFGELANAAPDG